MTQKHFIALADAIRQHQKGLYKLGKIETPVDGKFWIDVLGDFCAMSNPRFDRKKWIDYICRD